MSDLNKRIGAEIKRLRKEQGLTQSQLGELLNTSKGNVSSLETGRFNSSVETLEKVAVALKKELTFIFK